MAEELEENNNNETVGASNPFSMMLGATLGAANAAFPEDPSEWPVDANGSSNGNYVEWAPKSNIRPWRDNKTSDLTRHIKSPDGKDVMKVVYSPDTNKDHAKTIWRENEVVMDGDTYTYVEIGDLCWTQQNLKIHTGMTFNAGNYPNGNASLSASLGFSYNVGSHLSKVKAALPEGWRLPTQADYENMISAVSSKMPAPYRKYYLASNASPTASYCGTDDFGLSAMMCGYGQSKAAKDYGRRVYYYVDGVTNTVWYFSNTTTEEPYFYGRNLNSYYPFMRAVRDRIVVNENN